MNQRRINLIKRLQDEKIAERARENPNLALLLKSGFNFKEHKLEEVEVYDRGKDFIVYCPKTDRLLIEFYAGLKEANDLSKKRYLSKP